MSKITKNGIKAIIAILLMCSIQIATYLYTRNIPTEINEEIMNTVEIPAEKINKKNEETKEAKKWQIQIEKIGLTGEIAEGTTKEILNKNIGHFEETNIEKGNIGLAGHNRGYEVNYFEKLKYLQKGDKIQYIHNNYNNTYEVTKNIIIKDTDWEYLEDTEENMLTLITCVENEPNYRRCVQATEIEKEEIFEESNKNNNINRNNVNDELSNVNKYSTSDRKSTS